MRAFIALTIVLLFTVVPGQAQSAADETEIRAAIKQYINAHNKHDIKAMAAFIDDNWQNFTGERKGKASYGKWMTEWFEQNADRHLAVAKEIGIEFITSDVALYTYYQEVTGLVDDDGNAQPASKGLSGWLFARKGGQWKMRKWFWRPVEEIP